jgi:hypothetical protein
LFSFCICQGLAGIQSDISEIFVKHNIDGVGLSLLLREDLIRMGITKLDQQLILMQSIDLLLTLVRSIDQDFIDEKSFLLSRSIV